MGGFGAALARGLVGGLEGYGNYLKEEGVRREKIAAAEIDDRRQRALLDYRASLDDQNAEREHKRGLEKIAFTGKVNMVANQAELRTRGELKAAEDTREFQLWKQKQGIELTNAKALELYKTEQSIRADKAKQGWEPAGNDIDQETGTRVLYFRDKQGNIVTEDTGVVVQQKVATYDDRTMTTTTQAPKPTRVGTPGRRGEPAPAGEPRTRGGKTETAVISRADANAALQEAIRKRDAGAPGWAGLNDAQLYKKMQDVARAAGYTLPNY